MKLNFQQVDGSSSATPVLPPPSTIPPRRVFHSNSAAPAPQLLIPSSEDPQNTNDDHTTVHSSSPLPIMAVPQHPLQISPSCTTEAFPVARDSSSYPPSQLLPPQAPHPHNLRADNPRRTSRQMSQPRRGRSSLRPSRENPYKIVLYVLGMLAVLATPFVLPIAITNVMRLARASRHILPVEIRLTERAKHTLFQVWSDALDAINISPTRKKTWSPSITWTGSTTVSPQNSTSVSPTNSAIGNEEIMSSLTDTKPQSTMMNSEQGPKTTSTESETSPQLHPFDQSTLTTTKVDQRISEQQSTHGGPALSMQHSVNLPNVIGLSENGIGSAQAWGHREQQNPQYTTAMSLSAFSQPVEIPMHASFPNVVHPNNFPYKHAGNFRPMSGANGMYNGFNPQIGTMNVGTTPVKDPMNQRSGHELAGYLTNPGQSIHGVAKGTQTYSDSMYHGSDREDTNKLVSTSVGETLANIEGKASGVNNGYNVNTFQEVKDLRSPREGLKESNRIVENRPQRDEALRGGESLRKSNVDKVSMNDNLHRLNKGHNDVREILSKRGPALQHNLETDAVRERRARSAQLNDLGQGITDNDLDKLNINELQSEEKITSGDNIDTTVSEVKQNKDGTVSSEQNQKQNFSPITSEANIVRGTVGKVLAANEHLKRPENRMGDQVNKIFRHEGKIDLQAVDQEYSRQDHSENAKSVHRPRTDQRLMETGEISYIDPKTGTKVGNGGEEWDEMDESNRKSSHKGYHSFQDTDSYPGDEKDDTEVRHDRISEVHSSSGFHAGEASETPRKKGLGENSKTWAKFEVIRDGKLYLVDTIERRLSEEVVPHAADILLKILVQRMQDCPSRSIVGVSFDREKEIAGHVEMRTGCGRGLTCFGRAEVSNLHQLVIIGNGKDSSYLLVGHASQDNVKKWGPLRGPLRISVADDAAVIVHGQCSGRGSSPSPWVKTTSVGNLKYILGSIGAERESLFRWEHIFRYDSNPRGFTKNHGRRQRSYE